MSVYYFNIWAIPSFIAFASSFILTVFLFYKKSDDTQVRFFILAALFISLVCLGSAMDRCSLDPDVRLIWKSINTVASGFAVGLLFHFSHVFLVGGKPFENKKMVIVYLLPVFYMIYPLPLFFRTLPLPLASFRWIFFESFNRFFYYLSIGLLITLATINFFRMFRQHEDKELRRRSSYFVFSTLAILVSIAIVVVLVTVFGITPEVDLPVAVLPLYEGIIAYGIVKAKLFDIDLVVKKSFSYTATSLAIAFIFRFLQKGLEEVVLVDVFGGVPLSGVFAGAFAAVLFIPLKDFNDKITNKLFPDVEAISKSYKAKEIYKNLLEFALMDDHITEKANMMLKELRLFLRISDEVHESLESELRSLIEMNGKKKKKKSPKSIFISSLVKAIYRFFRE